MYFGGICLQGAASANIEVARPTAVGGGAFGQFLAEKRSIFQQETKGQPASAVSKLAGERWKSASAAEKAKYQQKYEGLKAQYDKDLKAYLASGGVVTTKPRKEKDGKRKKKDKNAPKKPAGGAYGRFLNAKRAEFTKECAHMSKKDQFFAVTKLAGERWKQLSPKEKQPYEEEFATAQKEYAKAMEEYKANGGGDDEEDGEEDEDDEEEDEEEEVPAAKKGRKAGA